MSRGRGTVDASPSIRQPCQHVAPVAGYPRSDTVLRCPTPTKRRAELPRVYVYRSTFTYHKIYGLFVRSEKIQKKSISEKTTAQSRWLRGSQCIE